MLALTDSPLLKVRPGLLTELVPTISLSTNESLQVFATNPQLRTFPLSQILDCPWWEVSKYSDRLHCPSNPGFCDKFVRKRIYHSTYCARRQKRADNQPYRCYWWHRRVLFLWSHIDRSANAHPALVLAHLSGCLHPHFDFNWKRLFIAWFGGYCNRPICHAAMLSHCTQRLCHASTLWQNLWLSTT